MPSIQKRISSALLFSSIHGFFFVSILLQNTTTAQRLAANLTAFTFSFRIVPHILPRIPFQPMSSFLTRGRRLYALSASSPGHYHSHQLDQLTGPCVTPNHLCATRSEQIRARPSNSSPPARPATHFQNTQQIPYEKNKHRRTKKQSPG